MIGWLIALLACCAAGAAAAAPLTVRSGDHPGFSRLVIYMAADPEWRFGRVDGGYELRVTAPDGFDTAAVYDMIRPDRIAALEDRGDGRLTLSVECDCHGDAFVIPQGIVIDIRDGPAPVGSGFEVRLEAPDAPDAIAGADPVPPIRATPVAPAGPAPVLLPGVALPGVPGLRANAPLSEVPGQAVPPIEPMRDSTPAVAALSPDGGMPGQDLSPTDVDLAVEEAARAIAEQLGSAADQGLVALSPPPAPVAVAPAPDPAPVQPEDAPVSTETSPPATLADHLRVQTVVDRDRPASALPPGDGDTCIADGRLDLAAWAGDRVAMAPYRVALVDAHDRPDPKAIRDAARHAIAIGFGAEARALLNAFDVPVPEAGLLDQLARLVDGGTLPASDLAGQIGCAGRAALWAVLARGRLMPGDPVDTAAVQAAFAALPPGLRRSLGPGLAAIFLEMGDADSAAALRNAMARAADGASPGLELLDARLGLPAGVDRLDRLAALSQGDSPEAVAALIALLEGMADAGKAPDDRLLLQAATLAMERGGTPEGVGLARAHLRGLIVAGRLPEAYDGLASLRAAGDLDEATLEALRVEAMAAVADAPLPDLAQVLPRLLAGPLPVLAGGAADAARRALALRLIDMGLPAAARQVMAARAAPPELADRLILARMHLADGAPEAALAELAGEKGPEADVLLARALMATGRPDGALAALARAGDAGDDALAQAAWRAGDWDRVAALGAQLQRSAAALAENPPGHPEAAQGASALLDVAADLLRRSEEVQRVYRQLVDGPAGG